MAKIVRRSTSVMHPKTQSAVWFHDGDELPAWAEPLVTNPAVFIPLGEEKPQRATRVESDVIDADAGAPPEPEEDPFAEELDYSKLTHAQLDELLTERELSISGSKPDKVARLEAHDAAHG